MKALPIGAELRARCREQLETDPAGPSGLRRTVNAGPAQAGSPAGRLDSRGYWQVRIDGKNYLVHRLIWALTHDEDPGDREIDHIDGKRGNNDPDNLQLAAGSENRCNGKLPCTNTSGHKGVCRQSSHAAWQSRVQVYGKRITKVFSDSKYGGTEAALAAAVEWVRAKREELHGEFVRHA